jgi:pyridoxamine 5'-phosphate oxidase
MSLLSGRRKTYALGALSEADMDPDPIAQFGSWLEQALASDLLEPTAMNLATVGASGRPSARMVLLKGVEAGGFVFYSNYASRKGRELAANPHAALTFYWDALERQVRVEGQVEKLSREASERYFQSRPPRRP